MCSTATSTTSRAGGRLGWAWGNCSRSDSSSAGAGRAGDGTAGMRTRAYFFGRMVRSARARRCRAISIGSPVSTSFAASSSALVAVFGALVILAGCAAREGVLLASWMPPTTNTDGSPLTNLESYRIYFNTVGSPCPGGLSVTVKATAVGRTPDGRVSVILSNFVVGHGERVFGNDERAGPARRPEVTIFAVPLLVYFFGRIVRSAIARNVRAIFDGLAAQRQLRSLQQHLVLRGADLRFAADAVGARLADGQSICYS